MKVLRYKLSDLCDALKSMQVSAIKDNRADWVEVFEEIIYHLEKSGEA